MTRGVAQASGEIREVAARGRLAGAVRGGLVKVCEFVLLIDVAVKAVALIDENDCTTVAAIERHLDASGWRMDEVRRCVEMLVAEGVFHVWPTDPGFFVIGQGPAFPQRFRGRAE
jgi:hypothetical protein